MPPPRCGSQTNTSLIVPIGVEPKYGGMVRTRPATKPRIAPACSASMSGDAARFDAERPAKEILVIVDRSGGELFGAVRQRQQQLEFQIEALLVRRLCGIRIHEERIGRPRDLVSKAQVIEEPDARI